jgi:hypothetical protein
MMHDFSLLRSGVRSNKLRAAFIYSYSLTFCKAPCLAHIHLLNVVLRLDGHLDSRWPTGVQ